MSLASIEFHQPTMILLWNYITFSNRYFTSCGYCWQWLHRNPFIRLTFAYLWWTVALFHLVALACLRKQVHCNYRIWKAGFIACLGLPYPREQSMATFQALATWLEFGSCITPIFSCFHLPHYWGLIMSMWGLPSKETSRGWIIQLLDTGLVQIQISKG